MLTPVTFDRFAGLNLAGDPQEAGLSAIDALNVDFDTAGRVRTRDGYTQLSAGSTDFALYSMTHYGSAGNFVTLDWANKRGRVYDNTGAVVASSSALATNAITLANIGTPTATYVYAPTGDVLGRLARWDGASWTYPAPGYSASYAGVTPWDNRLILANENSPTTNGHRVRFSDPGAPETFAADNFVDLAPGDNEAITGIVTWRDKVFVFKYTKFFVFYGVSTDSTGGAIFNYRSVTAVGIERGGAFNGGVATDDGVYFAGANGVFRTTGGPPEKVSTAIDPLFNVGNANHFTSGFNLGTFVLGRFRRKVILCVAGTTDYCLVYDTETAAWSYWNVPANSVLEYKSSAATTAVLLFAANDGKLHTIAPAYTADNGTAIASKYRTGFLDLSTPESEKVVREWLLDGTGTPTFKVATNDSATLGTGATVTLGTSPAVAQGRDRRAVRGRNFSVEVSATSGAWSLSRLTANVLNQRPAGVKSP